MTPLIKEALKSLSASVNKSTGLTHPNDKNRAKETFIRLYKHGEILIESEIYDWALLNGWKSNDARELSNLGQKIGDGKKVKVEGKWWKENIIEIWQDYAKEIEDK